MNERCEKCRALPTRLGLFLLAVVVFAYGCASEDVAGQPGDASSDDATEYLHNNRRETRSVHTCTLDLGRTLGSLEVFNDPGAIPACKIAIPELPDSSRGFCFPDPGDPSSAGTCPDCLALKNTLGCTML